MAEPVTIPRSKNTVFGFDLSESDEEVQLAISPDGDISFPIFPSAVAGADGIQSVNVAIFFSSVFRDSVLITGNIPGRIAQLDDFLSKNHVGYMFSRDNMRDIVTPTGVNGISVSTFGWTAKSTAVTSG